MSERTRPSVYREVCPLKKHQIKLLPPGPKCAAELKRRAKNPLQPFQLCWFRPCGIPREAVERYPFTLTEVYVFIGEIPGMPGHGIIAERNGRMHTGYHVDNFVALTQEEL